MIEIGQFDLAQSTIEIRYDPAFTLWDRCGTIANELNQHFPNFKPGEVSILIHR